MEMLYVMLYYSEVTTDIDSVQIPTTPFKLRSGIYINTKSEENLE